MKWLKKILSVFTRKEFILFFAMLTIALVSFVALMWIIVFRSTTVVPAAGGQYTEGMVGQPEYINPVLASSETDLSLVKMIYSNIPDIADSITQSPDGRTWTVRLKDNITWSDGQKLTADDVIFTVQSIQNADADSPLYQSWEGVNAERVSELEVQFSFLKPYAFFADDLANLYIVPKHIFADTPVGNWHLSDYTLKPIGSGPYKFSSYNQQSDGVITSYDLETWNNYFGTKPLINNFNFNFFPNLTDMIKSFNAGGLNGMSGLESTDLTSLDRPYDLFDWRIPSYYAVFFNTSKNIALQDANVREALSASVDRDALVADVLGSNGKPEYGPIPEDAPNYIPVMATSSQDFASSTLTAAGWLVGTSTSFRSKTIAGAVVPLTVNLTVPDIPFLVATANELQNDWQEIGAQVTIATDTPENIANNTVKNRDYESLIFGNVLGPSSDLFAFWDSSQRFYPGLNLAIYSNPAVDTLVENAETNINPVSRATQFAEAEQDIVNDNPAIFLYSPDDIYITDKSVQGITPDFIPDPSDRLREVGTWYLNTARVLK